MPMGKAERARRYAINWEAENAKKAEKMRRARIALSDVHNVLDGATGDTDITHLSDRDLRRMYPAQWAAERIAKIIRGLQ